MPISGFPATTIWNRFTQIDSKDPEREFSMLIDFSDGDRYAGKFPGTDLLEDKRAHHDDTLVLKCRIVRRRLAVYRILWLS